MTCEQAELRMAELLAGEISPADRSLLERHLLDCAACRGDFELARAGARIEWADAPVPKEVIEATLASFREPAPVVRLLRWATAAAAVFGLAALVIASSRTAPRTGPAAPTTAAVRPQILATMQDPAVGAMVCKDEEGRPVGELGLKSHDVSVEIQDGIAKTTVEENFENHTDRRLEGTFHFPLPSDASISRLALEVNGKIEEGTCLERERAREVFEGIVRRMQDPALLEWQPGGFFKCRVFPIEPRSTKRVIVAYTQALPCFQGKMTYVYPLASDKTRTHAPEEVRIGVQARFSGALAKIESPSHHLEVQRKSANEAAMSFRAAHYRPNNDFVVSMEPEPEEVRVVSHKTDGEDGYFACFATPQGGGERKPSSYAFVLDVSASTSAPRLEVAKRLVRAMMERRIEGDRFEILAHHIDVERSGEVDLRAANTFMDRLQPIGGSDVLKALLAAGDAEIVYIGKGAPTAGETETAKILEAVKGRRIRTVAVGSDANGALLERLGGMMRVNPNDDLAKRVAEIAATLGAPVLSDVKIDGGDAVYDVVGVRDLFYGERLVVSGRYRGPGAKLTITGRGYRREIDVAFPAKEEKNNYVRRLWAQRKVADLLAQGPSTKDPVTELGVKYQIMTPYTSFLVLETEQMWKDHQLKREVQKQDEVLGKGGDELKRMAEAEASAHEIATKRIATMRMAGFLQQAYAAWEGRQYERAMKLCDEILKIDPHYQVAKDLKEGADKERHRTPFQDVMTPKVRQWKAVTQAGSAPVIPQSETVRFPNREEWNEIVKSFDQALLPGGTAEERQRQYESERHHEKAMQFRYTEADWEKAKAEAAKALECWHENAEARRFLNQLANEEFRVKTEQVRIEISKHLRDGQRYFDARMYEQAQKEFENAEFKILNLPPGQKELIDLLPTVNDSIAKSRARQILEERRTEQGKKRMAEGEASAKNLEPSARPDDPGPVGKLMPERSPTVTKQPAGDFFAPTLKSDPVPRTPPTPPLTVMTVAPSRPSATERTRSPETAEELVESLEIDGGPGEFRYMRGKGKPAPFAGEFDVLTKEPFVRGRPGMADFPGVDLGLVQEGKLRGWIEFDSDGKTVQDHSFRNTLDAERRLGGVDTWAGRYEADQQVLVRQLEVQLAEIQSLTMKTDEHRSKLAKSYSEKSLAVQDLEQARQVAERLQQDLGELESRQVELARNRKFLEEKMNGITQTGGNVNVAPKKALEGKVTAVANDIGLLVISIGKDDGVLEGDDFTVYRGGDFVAKVSIDRSDRKWAAGKVVLKKADPRVADDVSNHIFVSAPRDIEAKLACTVPSLELDVVSVAEDGNSVRLSSSTLTAVPNQVFAVVRGGRFVAMVRVDQVSGLQAEARPLRNLSAGRILPGDRAVHVSDPKAYLAALPVEVRMDLASRANQKLMRAKMGLKE